MQDKILVIQTAFLGDAILTLPMIEKLKEKFPNSLIDVIGIKSSKEIYESSPFVNEVHVFEKRGKHKSILGIYRFAKFLRGKGYSKVYSPHRSIRTSLLILFLKVKETYGFDTSTLSFVYKHRIRYRKDYHEVRRLLEIIGFNSDEENWKIIPKIKENKEVKDKVDLLTKDIEGRIIALAPGSVWETKKYPSVYYGKLAAMLTEAGCSVVLLGGAADAQLCEQMAAEGGKRVYSFAGRLSILESVFLLKKCSLVVSNDSAPSHMGLMASIPVLTIFCSTIPDFGFYPFHLNSESISYNDLECKPCGIHGLKKCPTGTFDCAHNITPEALFERIKAIQA